EAALDIRALAGVGDDAAIPGEFDPERPGEPRPRLDAEAGIEGVVGKLLPIREADVRAAPFLRGDAGDRAPLEPYPRRVEPRRIFPAPYGRLAERHQGDVVRVGRQEHRLAGRAFLRADHREAL